MSPEFKRNLLVVAGVHVVLVVVLVAIGLIRDWWPRKPAPPEITTYVQLQAPALPVPVEPTPQPQPEPPPEPVVEPVVEPAPAPEPKKNPVEVSQTRVPRPTPPPEPRKRFRAGQIHEQLREPASPAPSQDDFPFSWYFVLVKQALYAAWDKPSDESVAPGMVARIIITVKRDGTISQSLLRRSSGSALLDASALRAVESVSRLDPLPARYRGDRREITIDFELTDSEV